MNFSLADSQTEVSLTSVTIPNNEEHCYSTWIDLVVRPESRRGVANDVTIVVARILSVHDWNTSWKYIPVIDRGILVQFRARDQDTLSEGRGENGGTESLHLDWKFEVASLK